MFTATRPHAVLLALLGAAGCQSVGYSNLACTEAADCPSGYACGTAGHCEALTLTGDTGPGSGDAGDAGMSDSGFPDGNMHVDSGPQDSGPRDGGSCPLGDGGPGIFLDGTCTAPDAGFMGMGGPMSCGDSGFTDTQWDINNCGSCGNVCPSGQVCVAGFCGSVGTPSDPCAAAEPAIGMDADAGMLVVSAGVFWQGCNSSIDNQCDKNSCDGESPGRCVTLPAYEIDPTEVTQAAFQACIRAGSCSGTNVNGSMCDFNPTMTPMMPVGCTTWADAESYCLWAGKRLPTEAEWEKAARGTDGRVYPWGDSPPSCSLANYIGCPGMTPQTVGIATGNSPFGARDMAGNEAEWVADYYDPTYYSYATSDNPQGPSVTAPGVLSSGTSRILRGGNYVSGTAAVRASCRVAAPANELLRANGFRCARSVGP
jgi:formylglycine-generating enzyme required for sulfatase activity